MTTHLGLVLRIGETDCHESLKAIMTSAEHHTPQLANITKGLRHTPGSQTYIPGIDGLRAIAIVAVMLYHLDPKLLPGGFTGVDVFFVISGYVVSTSLSRDIKKSFGNFILGFYSRRIVRIFPALLVMLLVSSLLTSMFIPNSWLSTANRDAGLYAFFGLSNYALIWSNDGYFSPRIEFNPFAHTWSLAIEEQFYLIFPLLFYIWLSTRDSRDAIRYLGGSLITVLLIASLVYSANATTSNPERAYYLLPSRFWELAFGAWLFQLQSYGHATFITRSVSRWALFFGMLLVAIAFVWSDSQSFPFPWALLSVAGTALMIAGVSSPAISGTFLSRLLEWPAVTVIGKLSYSLYLWHWPVYVLFRWTVGLDSRLHWLWAVAITFLLAYLSYCFVENPIRRNQFVRSRPKWVIVLGGVLVLLFSWLVAGKLFEHKRHFNLGVTREVETWYPGSEPNIRASDDRSLCGSEKKHLSHEARDMTLSITIFQPRECKSQPSAGQRLFVLGDSHAGAYATMLRRLTESLGTEVWIYTKGGCPVANLINPHPAETKCGKFMRASLEDISTHGRPGDVLFLASLRMNRFGDQNGLRSAEEVRAAQYGEEALRDRELALKEAKAVLAHLQGSGLKILIDAPKPIFRAPPFRCSDWFNAANPVCRAGLSISRDELLEHREPIMDSISALASQRQDMFVWDPFFTLCPDATCFAFDAAGRPLFFDGDHLSAHGNHVLYPSFQEMLLRIWGNDS